MTSNYDPRPGRWMLPLVVLAMVAFTYLFVRELPSAASATNAPGGSTDSTITSSTTDGEGGSTTTQPVILDPESQAYLDGLVGYQTRLSEFQTQLAGANSGWDANPRTISFDQAAEVFTEVAEGVSALVGEIQAVVPPANLTEAHAGVVTAIQQAADAANGALIGLRAPSPDTGEARRAAVAAFDTAVQSFAAALVEASTVAGGG